MRKLKRLGAIALLSVGCVAPACGSRGPSDTAAQGSAEQLIRIDGSSTVFPITEAVAEEFQKTRPGAKVTVGTSGTGGGFQKFCRGETDLSNASRPIKSTELDACGKANIAFTELPVAYDGLAVIIHPKNTWVGSMTVAELKKLWAPDAQGRITRWNQLRVGWPDREIHLFGAGVDSGTYDYFTEAVVGKEGASRGDFTSSEDDNMLVQGIANDELALGFFGYAYYAANKDKLKLVPIDDMHEDNGKGAIAPSPASVRDGTYQPLSRPLFVYVSHRAADRPEVQAFLDFYLTQGPALVQEVGYVALGETGYKMAHERFRARTPGTMFGAGGSQVGVTVEQLLAR